MRLASRSTLLAALALATFAQAAAAQAPAQEAIGRADVAAKPAEEELSWGLMAGATVNTGNTESYLVNAGSRFRIVRDIHALTSEFAFNVGQARIKPTAEVPDPDYETTARNINAKLRYEIYMTPMDALFAAEIFRWDTFAGLDSRFQNQLGYQRHFIRVEKHRLWAEAGYDLTLDNFAPNPAMPNVQPEPNTDAVHSARLMLGYNNELNEHVLLLTELEALVNVEDPGDTRINYTLGLRTTLAESLKADLSFTLRADTDPPGEGAAELKAVDTLTQISLIYALM